MRHIILTSVLAAASLCAVGARATVVDFEQPISTEGAPAAPLFGSGDTFTQKGFIFEPFSVADGAQNGDLVGAIVDGSDPDTCSVVCPSNDSTHYFAGLNDAAIAMTAQDGSLFSLLQFDASFVGSGEDLAAAPFYSGFVQLTGYTAGYAHQFSEYYALEGASASGALFFNRYKTSEAFSSQEFVEVDAFGYYCPASGADCTAFNSNKAQFALDNLVVATTAVPEPAEWALLTAGLALVAGMARRRRRA